MRTGVVGHAAYGDRMEPALTTRSGYPSGVPCWIDTERTDPKAAADFYGDLFGWECEDQMPSDAPGRYLMARLHGHDVAAIGTTPDVPAAPVWNTYIAVDDADATAATVVDAGGRVLAEPFDVLDAGRLAIVADPSGAVFRLWQAGRHMGAALVNAPGTWNWSDLNTRAPQRAKEFYGRVFGWEADSLDFGGTEMTMWRRPGYGDFLETNVEPDLRKRQADSGAPPGFEDAVCWMSAITADQFPPDTPSHWAVTFAVDNTDAIANRAKERGGEVLVEPYDAAEFVRMAVLRDPQGAAFSINSFTPPE
jgi:predicted enzyme related to lactoylglutathione lyase